MPGFQATKVLDIELSQPIVTVDGLAGYGTLQILIRLHGTPIGNVTLPLTNDHCFASRLIDAILEQHSEAIIRHLVCDALAMPAQLDALHITDVPHVPHPVYRGSFPSVTVAVCTRDRTDDLARCLDSLRKIEYPLLDLLVIDNAPLNDDTKRLVRAYFPSVRYFCETKPGLDWARNRAIREAHGEIIVFTDDDAVVDPGWVKGVAAVFSEHPEVMLVTGLVVPYELETEAQVLFERCGGFGRGFERKWICSGHEAGERFKYYGTGQFGTGANMAYRRCVFAQIGDFDPALDVGTVTNGGGDLEMFFRILKEHHTLVYEPRAVVRHRHRREYSQLRKQLTNNGIGLYSYFVRSALAYPEERFAFLRFGLWWLRYWHFSHLLACIINPASIPRDLVLAELYGSFSGLVRYQKARQTAAQIARSTEFPLKTWKRIIPTTINRPIGAIAIRSIELRKTIPKLIDVLDYSCVRVFVLWQGRPLGSVDIANCRQSISASRLREAIANELSLKILGADRGLSVDSTEESARTVLRQHYLGFAEQSKVSQHYKPAQKEADLTAASPRLPAEVSVSVVVATLDRPDDLRNCLRCLVGQTSSRRIEILVVDNNPNSGITHRVVTEFPGSGS